MDKKRSRERIKEGGRRGSPYSIPDVQGLGRAQGPAPTPGTKSFHRAGRGTRIIRLYLGPSGRARAALSVRPQTPPLQTNKREGFRQLSLIPLLLRSVYRSWCSTRYNRPGGYRYTLAENRDETHHRPSCFSAVITSAVLKRNPQR